MKYMIAALFLACSGLAVAAQPTAVKSEILMQSDKAWDGADYKEYATGKPELTVLKVALPPHSALPWHTNPMPNASYIISGEITVESKATGKTEKLVAGQAVPEMVDAAYRATTGDKPVELVVFYAGVKGQPLSQPVK